MAVVKLLLRFSCSIEWKHNNLQLWKQVTLVYNSRVITSSGKWRITFGTWVHECSLCECHAISALFSYLIILNWRKTPYVINWVWATQNSFLCRGGWNCKGNNLKVLPFPPLYALMCLMDQLAMMMSRFVCAFNLILDYSSIHFFIHPAIILWVSLSNFILVVLIHSKSYNAKITWTFRWLHLPVTLIKSTECWCQDALTFMVETY